MSIPATEAINSGMLTPLSTSASTNEDQQMFMELMVAQLRYQDPLNPADSGEFLAQTAQFNALEQMTKVAEQTATLVASQLAFGAAGMVGREVSYLKEDGTTATGRVNGVTFSTDGPMLDVGGTEVPLAWVATIHESAPSSTDTPTDAQA